MMIPKHSRQIISVTFIALVLVLGFTVRAGAQAGGPLITIDRVDSEEFPQVSAYVTVTDENGLPLAGLKEADFQVVEDGIEVHPASVVVSGDTTQPLGLVLAIDVSAPEEALAAVKAAAASFVETVNPQDRAAILAYADEVERVQDFTNNTQVLRDTIDRLAPAGETTALNEATLAAVTAAESLPTGRTAVVVVTNAADNASGPAAEKVAETAREAGIPIYTIGYGTQIQPESLRSLSQTTGGQTFVLPTPDDLPLTLRTIGVLLRQGYKVTFQSGVEADNAEHTLAIRVIYREQQAEAEAGFLALPGEVAVTLPDLAAGQVVGGVVILTPRATAPAPIASVEYLLNGKSLAKRANPPYSFEWDTGAVEPGPHALSVEVVDTSGNRGRVEIDLEVAGAPVVTLSRLEESAEPGGAVTVEARVDAPAGLTRVEFLLDGEVVATVVTPPYRFSFNSADYPPGEHVVVARAEDAFGRSAEAILPVQLRPPAARGMGKLPGALAVLVALVLAVAILGRIWAFSRRIRLRTLGLELENKGNVPSRFELRADDPAQALRFEFALNGAPLPRRQVTRVVTGREPAEIERPAAVAAAEPSPSRALVPAADGIGQVGGQLKQSSNGLIDLLSTITYILPYSMRGPLQQIVSGLRQGQFAARRVGGLPGRARAVLPSGAEAPSPPASAQAPALPAATGARAAAPATAEIVETVAEGWVQTPSVDPGECLRLELRIAPVKARQTRSYPFRVISRSLEQADAPEVIDQGTIQIVAPSWFKRLAPTALFIAVTVAVALVIASLLVGTGIVML